MAAKSVVSAGLASEVVPEIHSGICPNAQFISKWPLQ
jgi:hypothetical protein